VDEMSGTADERCDSEQSANGNKAVSKLKMPRIINNLTNNYDPLATERLK